MQTLYGYENANLFFYWILPVSLLVINIWIVIPIFIFWHVSINAYEESYALRYETLWKYTKTFKGIKKFFYDMGHKHFDSKKLKIVSVILTLVAIFMSYFSANWLYYVSIIILAVNITCFAGSKHDMKIFEKWKVV